MIDTIIDYAQGRIDAIRKRPNPIETAEFAEVLTLARTMAIEELEHVINVCQGVKKNEEMIDKLLAGTR